VRSSTSRAAALLAAALALAPGEALAQDAQGQYEELENQLRFVEQEHARPDETQAQRARRKLSDAETQFLLQNWRSVVVLLYDAVDVPEFRASADYATALYYLGESLYQEGDYKTARGYFRQVLAMPGAAHQREALVRALDVAVRTNDTKDVDQLVELGRNAFGDRPPAELAYLAAKSIVRRPGLDPAERRRRAIEAFAAVPPPLQQQAAYWQGALHVEGSDAERGLERFQACTAMPGKDPRQVEVRELCHMALGRVLADQGRIQEAVDHYQEVPRESPRFNEALYELAWAWVKAKRYEQALRTAALISDLSPESRMAPEATILQGHLNLKLGRYGDAIEAYNRVINRYAPVRDELDAILTNREDPVRYFHDILGQSDRAFNAAQVLPPVAAKWAANQPQVARALGVVGDVDTGRRDLAESRHMADRLDAMLLRNEGLDAFTALKEGHGRAEAVENGALWLEGRILEEEGAIVARALAPDQRAELERLRAARLELEKRVSTLPRTPAAIQQRLERLRARFAALDKAAFQLGYVVEASRAALSGTRAWIEQRRGESQGAEARAELLEEIRRQDVVVQTYEEELAAVHQEITRAIEAVEGPEGDAGEALLREEYRRAMSQEWAVLDPLRSLAPSSSRDRMDRLEAVRGRLPELMARAARAQTQLKGQARISASAMRERLTAERRRLDEQAAELARAQGETKGMVGDVALRSLRDVRGQFYDIVLKADVGVADVSWQKKRDRVEEIQKLSTQKSGDLGTMDGDYKGVLREVK